MQHWFKFYGVEYLSDPKMLGLSPMDRSCWITLLCYASQGYGVVINLTEDQLMVQAGVDFQREEWNDTKGVLERFKKLNMINVRNGKITVKNWKKRQESYLTDAERQARWRERNGGVTKPVTKVTLEVDKNREEEIREEKREKSRFAPPTLDEVKAYCKERDNSVSPTRFIDFYSSKGWMVGRNKMKDWRASVRTWEKDEPPKPKKVLPDKPITPEEVENRKKLLEKIRNSRLLK